MQHNTHKEHSVMHRQVEYRGPDAEERAMQDIRSWLGEQRFAFLEAEFRKWDHMSEMQFAVIMSFAGIQGFPVGVWYARLWPAHATWDAELNRDYVVH